MLFFSLLLFASLIAGVVGLIKPSLVLPAKAGPTRPKVLTVYGILLIISFMALRTISQRPEVQTRLAAEQAERQLQAEKEKLAQDQEKSRADQERATRAAAETAERQKQDELRHPEKKMTLKVLQWQTGGFGTVMIANFAVQNDNSFPVKDLAISCDVSGNSGTKIGSVSKTIYEVVEANKAATFKEVNMGLIRDQAARASCEIRSAKTASD